MTKFTVLLAAGMIAGASSFALAQSGGAGSGPSPGDARPPQALKQGGIPPAAAMRRGDDMAPANTGGVANAKMTKKASKKKHKQM